MPDTQALIEHLDRGLTVVDLEQLGDRDLLRLLNLLDHWAKIAAPIMQRRFDQTARELDARIATAKRERQNDMSEYRMDDGTIVDTDKASQTWKEDLRFDGSNFVSANTGSQWEHEQLYRSSKGRYYLERWSQFQGSTPSAEWMTPEQAAAWLILNREELPEDLAHLEAEVTE